LGFRNILHVEYGILRLTYRFERLCESYLHDSFIRVI
jgi:hypothetical protein